MRSLLHSVELPDLIKCIDARGESAVEAENLVFDDSCQWQIVEELCELFPNICVAVFPQTLIIEAITKHREKAHVKP